MRKKESGKFFGAIQEDKYEVKVASTKEEVEAWFKKSHPLCCKKLVWFQGDVDVKNNSVTFRLFEENKDSKLNAAQRNRVKIEITCFVQFVYGKIKGRVIPGTMKGEIIAFIEKMATKDK